MTKGKSILIFSTLAIVGSYFLFLGLAKAHPFLAPLFTAIILSLLLLPLSNKMERSFSNRTTASLLNTFLLFLISLGFMALISFQIKNFVDQWPKIQETMKPKIEQLKGFVLEHTPIERSTIQNSSQGSMVPLIGGSSTNSQNSAAQFFTGVLSFFGDYLLTFIYVFFILNYRHRFKEFLLRLFPDEQRKKVKSIISNSALVAQQYLMGRLLLILILAVLYAIGFGISGVNNFILISALAALFSLVPYVGNLIALFMAMAFGYLTSGELSVLIGIIITYSIAQFVESYILEPYIVGDKVDLHPFFVIIAVVIGGMIWGVIGMILAIPILAIINVVFRHIPVLHPFGFLFSKDDPE